MFHQKDEKFPQFLGKQLYCSIRPNKVRYTNKYRLKILYIPWLTIFIFTFVTKITFIKRNRSLKIRVFTKCCEHRRAYWIRLLSFRWRYRGMRWPIQERTSPKGEGFIYLLWDKILGLWCKIGKSRFRPGFRPKYHTVRRMEDSEVMVCV